jgi:RHS repeat-associated protein
VLSIARAYTSLGQLASVKSFASADGASGLLDETAWTYDGWGNVLSSTQDHDGAGEGEPLTVAYGYDDLARLASVTYPDGRVILYQYGSAGSLDDQLSRVTAITDSGGTEVYVQYTYLGAGTIVRVDHPEVSGGLTLDMDPAGDNTFAGLDRFGRVIQQFWMDSSGEEILDGYSYTYDGAGNVTTRSNVLNSALSEAYAYDGLSRLTATVRNSQDYQAWSLDGVGNWTNFQADTTGNGSYDLDQDRANDTANQLTSVEGWTTPEYDLAGNMTLAPVPGSESTGMKLTYDAWNHLVKVETVGETPQAVAIYAYDGLGRRIVKLVPNGENWDRTDFYYNESWQVLEERKESFESLELAHGTVAVNAYAQYLWDIRYIDAPVLRWHDSDGGQDHTLDEALYYCNDANMNVTALVNTSGSVVEQYAYDSYGKVMIYSGDWSQTRESSAYDNEILYCGYRFDPETGLYSVRHRMYHPTLGQWVQRDPIGYADGLDAYAYSLCDPATAKDPTGLYVGSEEGLPIIAELKQNIKKYFSKMCPCVEIKDSPGLFWRFNMKTVKFDDVSVAKYWAAPLSGKGENEDTFCKCILKHCAGCRIVHDLLTAGVDTMMEYMPGFQGAEFAFGGLVAGTQSYASIGWNWDFAGTADIVSGPLVNKVPDPQYKEENVTSILGHEMMHDVDFSYAISQTEHKKPYNDVALREPTEQLASQVQNQIFRELAPNTTSRREKVNWSKLVPQKVKGGTQYNREIHTVNVPQGNYWKCDKDLAKKWYGELIGVPTDMPGWGVEAPYESLLLHK